MLMRIHISRHRYVPSSITRRFFTDGEARLHFSRRPLSLKLDLDPSARIRSTIYSCLSVQKAKVPESRVICNCRYYSTDNNNNKNQTTVSNSGQVASRSQQKGRDDKVGGEGAVDGPDQEETDSDVGEEDDQGSDDEDEDDVSEEGLVLTDEQMQYLSKGDPEVIKKIKYIQLEHAVMRQEGHQVPSKIKLKHWEELLNLNSKSRRQKFHMYLFKTEMSQMNRKRKKQERYEQRMKQFAENPMPSREEDKYGMFYGLNRNTLFLRLYDTTVNKLYNGNVCSAMLHHPPLVFDCSYDEFMTQRESKNCAKQIELAIAENRQHKEPYNIYLCNATRESKMMKYLRRMIPNLDEPSYIVNVHEESYMDLFPKNRLVYLSPHTRDDLEEYDEDDIYIVGAMVDKAAPRPYSLAKAKKLDITMKRLPLDKYLMWGLGGKSLTLNQMIKIMLDVRYTRGDWKEALKHVPTRKLFQPYRDQPVDGEQRQDGNQDLRSPEPWTSRRKEKKSIVFEDYELLNRQKGFRRSTMSIRPTSQERPFDRVRSPNMRTLLRDTD